MSSKRFNRREWLQTASAGVAAGWAAACDSKSGTVQMPEQNSPFGDVAPTDRPNIVLFISDTLRADHLSCYGHEPRTSPMVDLLAHNGVLFERCTSASTWTKPSLSSMFTGVPPRVHQAVIAEGEVSALIEFDEYRVQVLREQFKTLASTLKDVGYSTCSLIGNVHGRPEFGYGRGFDKTVYKPAYNVTHQISDAIDWLWAGAAEPFFLCIHQIDPHGPYTPPDLAFHELHGKPKEEAATIMEAKEAEEIQAFLDYYGNIQARQIIDRMSPEAIEYLKMLYDAEIFEVDFNLKRFVNHLDRIGVSDRTIFVFTSDHGEAFYEHGFFAHGTSRAYQELAHVPLVLAGAQVPKGVRVPHSTSMIDLYPTIAALAGAIPPDYISGSPLISTEGEVLVDADRLAFVDLDHKVPDVNRWDASLVNGRHRIESNKRAGTYSIYDLLDDPEEKNNCWGESHMHKADQEALVASLANEIDKYDKLAKTFGEPVWMEASDGVHEELEALGYL